MKRALASVLLFMLALSSCLSSCPCLFLFESRAPGPKSDALFEAGEKNRWYLHAGSCFYELWGDVEARCLPKDPAAKGPVASLDTFWLYGFNLTPDQQRFIVRSYPPGAPPMTEPLQYLVMDRDLKVVDRKENLGGLQRLSPDGKYLLSASDWEHGTGEITLTDVATKESRVIASDNWHGRGVGLGMPDWAPDSKRFVYTTNDIKVAIFDVTTGQQQILGPGRGASWSPRGDEIACLPPDPFKGYPLLYDVNTGQAKELFRYPVYNTMTWSPDGRFLIFPWEDVQSSYSDLSFFDRDTGELHVTGKRTASIRDGKIYTLPDWLVNKLVLVTENPNRDPLPVGKD